MRLAAVHEFLDALLNGLELVHAGPGGGYAVGDVRGLFGVGLEGAHHIHPVEGMEMIEMDDVIMEELCPHEKVSDDPCVVRNGHLGGHVHATHRGEGMDVGADAARALGKEPCITGVAPLQDELESAEKGRAAPSVFHLAVLHFHFDAQVALDASNGIHYHSLCHCMGLLFLDGSCLQSWLTDERDTHPGYRSL
jgi:hypothetical protein